MNQSKKYAAPPINPLKTRALRERKGPSFAICQSPHHHSQIARPLRIDFPGAVYHVTSRVERREPLFEDDEDRRGQSCGTFVLPDQLHRSAGRAQRCDSKRQDVPFFIMTLFSIDP